jgi:hypothetical protein
MISLHVHIVTLRLLSSTNTSLLDYLKTYIDDPLAWQAYFQTSSKPPSDLIDDAFKILPHEVAVEIAVRFAQEVLSIFEKEYASDDRPRKAIEAARAWIANPNEKTAYATNAAANAANAAYAAYAANAANAANAAYAAANAAYAAANAAYAAANAAYATAYAANAAANATYAAHVAANAAYAANNYDQSIFDSHQRHQLTTIVNVIRDRSIQMNDDLLACTV